MLSSQANKPATAEALEYWSKIKRINLPDRIKQLTDAPDDPEARSLMTNFCIKNRLPIILITFNRYQKTNEEFLLLQCIAGISPQTAMSELQKRAVERLAKFQ